MLKQRKTREWHFKNNPNYAMRGKHHSEKTKKVMRSIHKKDNYGLSSRFKLGHKVNLGKKNALGNILSEKKKLKMKIAHKNTSIETRTKIGMANKGKIVSKDTKKKMRISAINYVKKITGILHPRIGQNENLILDLLERELKHKIIRQFKIEGYFLDGYIPELNLAIEVDERPKIKEKDLERQKAIEKILNCKFIRVEDYD